MTGYPQFNYPLFDATAETLRARGYQVISPAEMDDPATREMALKSKDGAPGSGTTKNETWADFLMRDVKLVADGVTGIVFLPNWQHSRGARLEAFVGLLCGKDFATTFSGREVQYRTDDYVRDMLKDNMP